MNSVELATLIVSVLLAAGLGTALNAFAQRRKLGADATSVVTAAAKELIDPLRKELATERAEHAEEIANERRKVAELRKELDAAVSEARSLRKELARAWGQVEDAERRLAALRRGMPQ